MKSIIQSLSSRASLTLRLALILLLVAVGASAQEVFRLTGKVTDKDTKEPLLGVSIVDSTTHRAIAVTDMDGRFAVDVHSGSILRFSMVGLQSQVVKVKSSQKYIEVKLEQTEVALQELVVSDCRVASLSALISSICSRILLISATLLGSEASNLALLIGKRRFTSPLLSRICTSGLGQ